MSPRRILPILALAASASAALAQNLFVISGTSNGTAFDPIGADSIIDLVSDAVDNQDRFAFLEGTDATLNLSYGGVADAITVQKNAANTQATLSFLNPDGSRTSRTFDTSSPDANGRDLETLITDYLKKDGSSDLARFFEAMNRLSPIAVSDGNPNSTTARMGDYAFQRFGFHNDFSHAILGPTLAPRPDPAAPSSDERQRAGMQLRFELTGKSFESGDFDGETAQLSSSLEFNPGQTLGLSLGSFLAWNTVGEADVFHLGVTLGAPIRLILPREDLPFTWQLTPFGAVAGSGSEDVGAGGLVYSFGATSYLAWHFHDRFTLAMSNQVAMFEGSELSFGDFSIDPGVSQSQLKNALRLTYSFSPEWYAYAGAAHSLYLDDAAVESWISPAIGLGFHNEAGTGFEIGALGDFGDVEGGGDYTALGLRIGLNLAF